MAGVWTLIATGVMWAQVSSGQPSHDPMFYVPENPRYTICDSAIDSLRFTAGKTLRPDEHGHLVSISSFVDSDGQVMGWHGFGNVEGPGWASNAVGGAYEMQTLGAFLHRPEWQRKALSVLDHVLDDGFIDPKSGFIRGYRDTTTGNLYLNYKKNNDWFGPGSMAKVGYQLLIFSDELGTDPRAARMRASAVRAAQWIQNHLQSAPNGWYPRRATADGKLFRKNPKGEDDILWEDSADGLYILQLDAALTARGLADYTATLRQKADVFIRAGGFFGSINQDTFDAHENVAYSVAFRTLLAVSRVLKDDAIRTFAYEHCLNGLEHFRIREDRNGVPTKGLLIMEDSWDTAYQWENAEAALAYFEAAADSQPRAPEQRIQYEKDGLTILRAIAKHHHGPDGFLTEGVDWNNHAGQKHHFDNARFGDIRYTEPFLNNQHISEPTLFYLKNLARNAAGKSGREWRDAEGNVILKMP
jgi:hypothetical protein